MPEHLTENSSSLIKAMIDVMPENRPTAKEVH